MTQAQSNPPMARSQSPSPERPSLRKETLKLPERDGYHVLLGVWEIAEIDKAFYQVVDLNFVPN
ncbi:lytic polysaccharide monooxygenase [Pseudomonas sp. 17391]|nr:MULTISPECIES: lytic polysaccharide monooxygenase [unclassified Pseudomonas]MDD2130406.1 lytic polysaccharide monooxygenase [Pseudomonas sp. 17391]